MSSTPDIGVIIPTCDRLDQIKACLDCLKPQVDALPCAVIVSDDGRTSKTKDSLAVEYPWVTWVAGPRKGPAANRNMGASRARGKWLIFIDDDCLPDPDFLEVYASYFRENPSLQSAEGVIYPDRPQRSLGEGCPQNLDGERFWSCNLAFLRETFESLGGFDADYPYPACEDMDLYLRVRKQGVSVAFVEAARVCHPWRKLTVWRRFWQQRRSTLIYLDKHPEERELFTGRIAFKVVVGRIIKDTIPQGIAFRGRGVLGALAFDCLDLLFGLFLGARNIFRRFGL